MPCRPIRCRARVPVLPGPLVEVGRHSCTMRVVFFWGFAFISRGAAIVACCAAAARRTQTWPLALAGIRRGVRWLLLLQIASLVRAAGKCARGLKG